MRAVKQRTATFTQPVDAVYDAVRGVIQNGKFVLRGAQNDQHELFFTRGLTPLTWGTQYIAQVAADGSGTVLSVHCGGVDGTPPALIDGWKHGRAADKVIAQVQAAVDGSTPAPSEPVESFATTADGSTIPWPGGPWPGA